MYQYKGTRGKFGLTDDSGSEHALNGKKYGLESQKIFVSSDGQTAIISVFFEVTESGFNIPSDILASLGTDGSSSQTTTYNPTLNYCFGANGTPYAFYVGTNTLPPCSPNVFWFISLAIKQITPESVSIVFFMRRIHKFSYLQLLSLRKIMGPNGVSAAADYRTIQGTSSNGIIIGLSSSGDD